VNFPQIEAVVATLRGKDDAPSVGMPVGMLIEAAAVADDYRVARRAVVPPDLAAEGRATVMNVYNADAAAPDTD
jgi:hypothetical protein